MLRGPGRGPVAKTTYVTLLAIAGAALAASAAPARTGGASLTGVSAPAIDRIVCLRGCAADGAVERGGRLALRGRLLDQARGVVFLGGRGGRDDARVAARARGRDGSRLDVTVPAHARSGRIALVTGAGVAPQASAATVKVVRPGAARTTAEQAEPTLAVVRGLPQLEAGVAVRRAGAAVSAATIAYVSHASSAISVRVDVVRRDDGVSVFNDQRTVRAEERQTISWDGRAGDAVALDGRYEVRISTDTAAASRDVAPEAVAGGATPASAPPPPGSVRLVAFSFVAAVFPVRGTHDYGQAGARFGAGRGGYAHQGQDVMAACGTPVVAARGGIVKHKATHGAAGNYVVISDEIGGEDHAYMHLRDPAIVARGDRVQTGQLIGVVGATGRASACHLHFEIWSAPGWYEGGGPIDPLPVLRRWDQTS